MDTIATPTKRRPPMTTTAVTKLDLVTATGTWALRTDRGTLHLDLDACQVRASRGWVPLVSVERQDGSPATTLQVGDVVVLLVDAAAGWCPPTRWVVTIEQIRREGTP